MSEWPFIARVDELRRASEALRPDSGFHGVVLVGEAGVGKTTLARKIAQLLESDGFEPRFVLGTQTGRAIPLGAFHRALPIDDAHEPAVMLAAAHRALACEEGLVLVVDDAHLLDPLSALLIHQLAAGDTTPLIVTIRSGEPIPDAVTALWKQQWLIRLDVAAFARAETEELIVAVLDGDVDNSAIDHLQRVAEGSPLVLRGLLNAARDDHVLVRKDGRWRLRGKLRVGADLDELVEARLQTLAADDLDVIEVLAAAEVLDWEVLRTLCSSDAVARVEQRGLIQLVADGAHTLTRLSHPVVGEVVRRRSGLARTRELNTQLAQRLSDQLRLQKSTAVRPDVRAVIQLARLMTQSDLVPDLEVITAAAAAAVTLSELELGEQLARFACHRGGGLPAASVLADAISWQGRGPEAESILAEFDPDGTDELATVRWGCLRAANLFFGCGRDAEARTVLAAVRSRVSSTGALSFVAAIEVSFAFFGGDTSTAIALGSAALDAEMVPMATVWAAMATAGALAVAGRFAEVAEVAAQGIRAAQRCESGPQRYTVGLAEMLAFTEAGDMAAAIGVCERYAVLAAGVPQADAIVKALIGRVELARGRLAVACEALQATLWTMAGSLPAGWVMLVASWLAQAEGACGNADGTAAALARAEEANGPQVAVFGPELELAWSWDRACSGQTTAAREHAVAAARIARNGGMHAVELRALHTAVRFGDRSHATRLRHLAAHIDAPLPTAIAAHARALTEHDGDGLDAAADRFEQLGTTALAADALAQASREHARAGTRAKELESATRARWLASECGLLSPALRSVEDPLPITDREREIASLVGDGLTNRQIADRLGVSVRTIDGHLYRIFNKLRIADRDQLARLVRRQPSRSQADGEN